MVGASNGKQICHELLADWIDKMSPPIFKHAAKFVIDGRLVFGWEGSIRQRVLIALTQFSNL